MLTKERIDELKLEHPQAILGVIENERVAPGKSYVVRIDQGCWDRFTSQRANEEALPGAIKTFVLSIMVDPAAPELLEDSKAQPAIFETLAKEAIKLYGADAASTSRKL